MSHSGSILFTPQSVRNVLIKNRFMASPLHMGDSDDNGFPSEHLLSHYRDMAHGDVGLIIPGYVYAMKSGKASAKQSGMEFDCQAEAWRDTIQHAHRCGSRIIFQVSHGGVTCTKGMTGSMPLGPSQTSSENRSMTIEEIEQVIDKFRDAAYRLKKVGADGIQIDASAGYLINQFLSPEMNKRNDKYGGSLENRARLLREIVEEVAKVATPEFIIAMKINGSDCTESGCSPEDIGNIVASLPRMDLTEVTGGIGYWTDSIRGFFNPNMKGLNQEQKAAMVTAKKMMNPKYPFFEGYNLDFARTIRKIATNTVVAAVGGFRSFDVMEKAVKSGDIDIVSLGRPLLKEPGLIRDFYNGKTAQSTCASCGQCIAFLDLQTPVNCYLKN